MQERHTAFYFKEIFYSHELLYSKHLQCFLIHGLLTWMVQSTISFNHCLQQTSQLDLQFSSLGSLGVVILIYQEVHTFAKLALPKKMLLYILPSTTVDVAPKVAFITETMIQDQRSVVTDNKTPS